MTQTEALNIFRSTGALLEGHFVLRSGFHSRQFFQCALALQEMPVVERLGEALAAYLQPYQPTTILAPAMGGLVIGQEVARQLRCRFLFAEKEEGKLVLRRGFQWHPNEPVAVVEDVVTQGGRIQETIRIGKEGGAKVVAAAALVDRSNGGLDLGVPFFSLIRMEVESYPPDQLPPDLAATPARKPGSN